MANNYQKMLNNIKDFSDSTVKYRSNRYCGRGRPRKSDYTVCKYKNLLDVQLAEMLSSGFTTSYTN